jgi:alkylhydroperoxidase family enzyme
METFLPPIESPRGLIHKIAFALSKKQFGKVPTPLKVVYARLPAAFGMFVSKIGKLDKKLQLPAEMAMLIRERVAQINICEFCMEASMNEAKFDALTEYKTSSLFNEAERAALDYVTELTRDKKVAPETFERVRKHYSERAICEMVWLMASEHFYNITNLGLNIHSDMLCDIARKR